MQVNVFGGNETEIGTHGLRTMLNFFAMTLMGRDLSNEIEIDLYINENLGIIDGLCHPLEEEEGHPRTFEIALNPNISLGSQATTLAHEMVHVKQYALGELESTENAFRWNGKLYAPRTYFDRFLCPWEKEAYSKEKMLVNMFLMLGKGT